MAFLGRRRLTPGSVQFFLSGPRSGRGLLARGRPNLAFLHSSLLIRDLLDVVLLNVKEPKILGLLLRV